MSSRNEARKALTLEQLQELELLAATPPNVANGQPRPKGVFMKATIEKGRALVLVGPQGCGKTLLARKLAAAAGNYCEISVHELESSRYFWSWLEQAPATCIIEGMPRQPETLLRLTQMIADPETVVQRKHQEARTVRSPNFIFCTNDPNPLKYLDGRRYHIVHMAPLVELVGRTLEFSRRTRSVRMTG